MKFRLRLLNASRALVLSATLASAFASASHAQNPQARPFRAGELVLYCKTGTPLADVSALAGTVGATVDPLLLPDCYRLVLPANKATDQDTLSSVATLKADARVRWVGPNQYKQIHQSTPFLTPNDPRFAEQWWLQQIRVPQAWVLQKGATGVTVCVIDSGFAPLHPDFLNRLHSGSKDFGQNRDDPTFNAETHGVGVSGSIGANTNNGVGIASVCGWSDNGAGVKVLGLKISDATGGLVLSAIINSLQYVSLHRIEWNIVAVNMSYGGGGDPTDFTNPEIAAMKTASDAGVIMVASAGNSNATDTSTVPAGVSFVQTVSALGPSKAKASYSSFGKVDFAAPGGEFGPPDGNGFLTLWNATGYEFVQGTSFSSPATAGVVGLMMSVPGITPAVAVQTLKDTADRSRISGSVPDSVYGYGIVDAYAALLKVSVSATVLDPGGVDSQGRTTDPSGIAPVIQTFKPKIRVQVANIPLSQLQIAVDGVTLPSSDYTVESGNASDSTGVKVIAVRHKFPITAPYQHTITVTGTNSITAQTVTDTRIITLSPYNIKAGDSLFSVPLYESAADSPSGLQFREADQLLGPDVTLFRYNPENAFSYDMYVLNPGKIDATDPRLKYVKVQQKPLSDAFKPLGSEALPNVDGASSTDAVPRPVGNAYFVRTNSSVPVISYGQEFGSGTNPKSFRVPLHEGWNLVGSPFTYAVSFNGTFVDLPNGTRITTQDAVDRKILLPFIYRYIGGDYQYRVLPDGVLAPWEGHWLYVRPTGNPTVTYTLVLPPTPISGTSGRAANRTRAAQYISTNPTDGTPRISGPGSWALQLVAKANNVNDSYNYVGMSSKATDGEDLTKVPKPPKPSPFVTVGVTRAATPGVIYAQDMRPIGGMKTWDVVVNTDQTGNEVSLNWPNIGSVPRTYRLTLTDRVTGQSIDLRNQTGYRFTPQANTTTRSFTLTARPALAPGRSLLANIYVNPSRNSDGRSAGLFEIGYTTTRDANVEISVLAANGRILSTLSTTRSVNAGDSKAYWNGKDNAGRTLPAGTYILQLKAMTTEGIVTRESRPLILTGR